MLTSQSDRFKLSVGDLKKVGVGVLVAAVPVVATWVGNWCGQFSDDTMTGALIVGIGGVLVNLARKWAAKNTDKK